MTLALFGVGLSVLTGNAVFDGVATVCIGGLLATIAVLLAREIASLLIGEAAVPERIAKIYVLSSARIIYLEPDINRPEPTVR